MYRSFLLVPLAFLVACPPAADKDVGVDDTGTGPVGCEVTIEETLPVPDSISADYRADIEFHLSDPDSTATITSTIAGTTTLLDDGETVVFNPTDSLASSTAYAVTLDYCGGSATLNFTTSALGTELAEPSILVGRTYALDLRNARIVEPAGIGSVLTSYLEQVILVGVSSVSDTEIEMLGAIAKEAVEPPAQEFCDPSIPFPPAAFTQPFFQIGPETTTLSVAGYALEVGDLEISGTFAADATYFGGGVLAGTIDTRPLAPLLDDSGDEGAICDLAISFGAVCEACPADGEPFCLTLVADQIVGAEVEGTTLVTVAGTDCEGCTEGPPAEDAVCADPDAP